MDEKLIGLLKSLSEEEWLRPTVARQWMVRDVAAHLLDGNLKGIALLRDGHFPSPPSGILNNHQQLVAYLNQMNADWVAACRRLSTAQLIDGIAASGAQYRECLEKLDLFGPAIFPVSWAGQRESQNWFHIAREFTEKWHHQQQIREAVQKPGILTPDFCSPLIAAFMMALPHHYRNYQAPLHTIISVRITGPGKGNWFIRKDSSGWVPTDNTGQPLCQITLDTDTAWKIFTKAMGPDQSRELVTIEGEKSLAEPLLHMITIVG